MAHITIGVLVGAIGGYTVSQVTNGLKPVEPVNKNSVIINGKLEEHIENVSNIKIIAYSLLALVLIVSVVLMIRWYTKCIKKRSANEIHLQTRNNPNNVIPI